MIGLTIALLVLTLALLVVAFVTLLVIKRVTINQVRLWWSALRVKCVFIRKYICFLVKKWRKRSETLSKVTLSDGTIRTEYDSCETLARLFRCLSFEIRENFPDDSTICIEISMDTDKHIWGYVVLYSDNRDEDWLHKHNVEKRLIRSDILFQYHEGHSQFPNHIEKITSLNNRIKISDYAINTEIWIKGHYENTSDLSHNFISYPSPKCTTTERSS